MKRWWWLVILVAGLSLGLADRACAQGWLTRPPASWGAAGRAAADAHPDRLEALWRASQAVPRPRASTYSPLSTYVYPEVPASEPVPGVVTPSGWRPAREAPVVYAPGGPMRAPPLTWSVDRPVDARPTFTVEPPSQTEGWQLRPDARPAGTMTYVRESRDGAARIYDPTPCLVCLRDDQPPGRREARVWAVQPVPIPGTTQVGSWHPVGSVQPMERDPTSPRFGLLPQTEVRQFGRVCTFCGDTTDVVTFPTVDTGRVLLASQLDAVIRLEMARRLRETDGGCGLGGCTSLVWGRGQARDSSGSWWSAYHASCVFCGGQATGVTPPDNAGSTATGFGRLHLRFGFPQPGAWRWSPALPGGEEGQTTANRAAIRAVSDHTLRLLERDNRPLRPMWAR